MKKSFLIILLLNIALCKTSFAQYFKVKEFEYFYGESLVQVKNHSFKIQLNGQRDINIHYPLVVDSGKLTERDTIAMIGELLRFKGDSRVCVFPVMCYEPSWSQIFMGETKQYSLQVEALFIINQLYFKHPFKYSPFPALLNTGTETVSTIKGKDIKEAYRQYTIWFKQIEKIGLNKAREQHLVPLNGVVKWY
jgi:hypothetical protein